MHREAPEFKRCCFCLPLRRGLIAWGYAKVGLDILMFTYTSLMFYFLACYGLKFISADLVIYVFFSACSVIDISFNIVFIVAGHKDGGCTSTCQQMELRYTDLTYTSGVNAIYNSILFFNRSLNLIVLHTFGSTLRALTVKSIKLLKVSYVYNMVWLGLLSLGTCLILYSDIYFIHKIWSFIEDHKYIILEVLTGSGLGISLIFIQIYIILLTRSEIRKLQNQTLEMHFTNHVAAEPLCTLHNVPVTDSNQCTDKKRTAQEVCTDEE